MSAQRSERREKRTACSTVEPADRCNAGEIAQRKAGRNLPAAISVGVGFECCWRWV